ncbi:hypothetical protein SAMN03080601_02522 [Alkalitalea saponilacus]|uniref:Transposase DDE domain-containing protein n=1 Tax=Alkalitalea saponilacus TaxID=889453 RepID=A0A1T5HNF1_9BACT|nr:hypothetical protein SAMN03080601_02522 [Alkalitalea saponilacus]
MESRFKKYNPCDILRLIFSHILIKLKSFSIALKVKININKVLSLQHKLTIRNGRGRIPPFE